MIEPLQFRMYLCTLNMNIYDYICMKHKDGLGLLFLNSCCCWNDMDLFCGGVNLTQLCTICEGRGVSECFFFFKVETLQRVHRPWHNQLPNSNAGQKSQAEVFIPPQHDGALALLHGSAHRHTSAYVCPHLGREVSVPSRQHTHTHSYTILYHSISSLTYF